MTCPNCDSHVAEGVQFCPNCGANVFLDAASASEQKPPKKAKRKLNLKAILLVAAVVFVVILVFVFVGIFSGNKGEKIANSLSEKLGRSVTIAEKYAGVTLSETSEFSVLKEIVKYDYIIESEKIVKVCGIRMPEWAVFVKNTQDDKIDSVTYYNFKVLEKNWKGQKSKSILDTNIVEYGMSLRDAKRSVPVLPLSITRTVDDKTTYLYKYYFVGEDKNEDAYYFSIDYDGDNAVTNAKNQEIDYISFLFK